MRFFHCTSCPLCKPSTLLMLLFQKCRFPLMSTCPRLQSRQNPTNHQRSQRICCLPHCSSLTYTQPSQGEKEITNLNIREACVGLSCMFCVLEYHDKIDVYLEILFICFLLTNDITSDWLFCACSIFCLSREISLSTGLLNAYLTDTKSLPSHSLS